MRRFLVLVAAGTLLLPRIASADPGLIGHYRLAEGPDVAGELALIPDGRFRYALAAGALDEETQGRWKMVGGEGKTCLAQ
tara:strand:+ start:8975 stop:9214 length:240 start_codon:yes stop_codon:yes gene_type:complete